MCPPLIASPDRGGRGWSMRDVCVGDGQSASRGGLPVPSSCRGPSRCICWGGGAWGGPHSPHNPPLQKLPPWGERRVPGGEGEDRTPAHLCRAACCPRGQSPHPRTSHLLERPHLDPPWVSSPLARTPSSLRLCPHLVFGDRPRPGVPPQLHVLCCVSACSLTTAGTLSFLLRIFGGPDSPHPVLYLEVCSAFLYPA